MSEQSVSLTAQPLQEVPILPLRDIVVYPHMVVSLSVKRRTSVKALEQAAPDTDKRILLLTQKDSTEDAPEAKDLYQVGTLANVLQLLKLPNGTVKALVEGIQRCTTTQIFNHSGYLTAHVIPLESPATLVDQTIEALMRSTLSQFEEYVKLIETIPIEIISTLADVEDPDRIADMITMHLALKPRDKQKILEAFPAELRLKKLFTLLEKELNLLKEQKRLQTRIKKKVKENQLKYILNEQMDVIQKELNALQGGNTDQEQLEKRIHTAKLPKEAKKKASDELNKLKSLPAMSAEAAVIRHYLDVLLAVPWHQSTTVTCDFEEAAASLEESHHGLAKIKERIVEFVAVHGRVQNLKAPILCLVGPPGVGKTSLGKAIAKATGRLFVRMSLGGVRDVAEIRGHRRTYVGSLPGQIIQKMVKAGVKNPLFLLDEIDKMAVGSQFDGDVASTLLEVLDPEQNNSFQDHYLDVSFDLSEVMFIGTANTPHKIPPALLDRMEVLQIPGYTESEKVDIARRYLLKKQKEGHGLKTDEFTVTESALQSIIRYFTREAGVRNLERELAKLCRKAVMELDRKVLPEKTSVFSTRKENPTKIVVTPRNLEKYLGVRRFRYGLAGQKDQIGQVTGLAWTEMGIGELLTIEAAVLPGKGKMQYTGHLGEVMQESIQAAFTVVKSRGIHLGIRADRYEKSDIHIHVPEGAIPKDGPSAGIGMCTALVSTLTQSPVRSDVAMTGEITLRGEILPIGGLKEKLLAAHRGEIRTVIIPEENKRDLKEIPKNITQGLTIHTVRWIDQALNLAFRTPLGTFQEGPNKLGLPLLTTVTSEISQTEGDIQVH